MKQRVFFRVEGNSVIGFGHYTRCIALAQALGTAVECHFFSHTIPVHLRSLLQAEQLGYTILETAGDFFTVCLPGIIVVADGYDFDETFRKRVVETGAKLVVIDDASEGRYTAHALINHAPGITATNFQLLPGGLVATGPDVALLRREFQTAAHGNRPVQGNRRVFVCFGGADPQQLTHSVVEELLAIAPDWEMETVVSTAFHPALRALSPRVHTHADLSSGEMIAVMQRCERAIVPASGLLVEALALGLQVISGYTADNQLQMYRGYNATGAFTDAGTFEPDALKTAWLQPKSATRRVIDGFAPHRLRNLFRALTTPGDFRLRYALPEDTPITFQWVNDPVVRAFSFSQTPTPFEAHADWFGNKLRNPLCVYYLAEVDGMAAGSIRFDLTGEQAMISYLLDPAFHGKKLGERLLAEGIRLLEQEAVVRESGVKKIAGKVQRENFPSVKTFEKLNFDCSAEEEGVLLFTRNLPL